MNKNINNFLEQMTQPYKIFSNSSMDNTVRNNYKNYLTEMDGLEKSLDHTRYSLRNRIFSGYDSNNPSNFKTERFRIYKENFEVFKEDKNYLLIDEKINNIMRSEKIMHLDHENFLLLTSHKHKFEGCLREIINRNNSKENPLTSFGTNKKIDLTSTFEKSKDFINERDTLTFLIEDLANIRSTNTRIHYITQKFPNYADVDNLILFNNACSKLGLKKSSLGKGLEGFKNYCNSSTNDLRNNFNIGRHNTDNLVNHPDYREIISKFSNVFNDLPRKDMEIVCQFVSKNEILGLICLEPFMIFVLGSVLFTKIIYPLHRKGVFSHIMTQVQVDYLEKKKTLTRIFSDKIINGHSFFVKLYLNLKIIFPIDFEFDYNKNYREDVEKIRVEAVVAQEKVSLGDSIRSIPKPEGLPGFGGIIAENTRVIISQVSVELGRGMGVAAKGIADGFVEKNQEQVAQIADKMEKTFDSKKPKE
jgi:hypothetical protein